jgi:hypothetical protein
MTLVLGVWGKIAGDPVGNNVRRMERGEAGRTHGGLDAGILSS